MDESFSTQRRIQFGDCDPAGVVYAPRVADYIVEASHEFLGVRLGTPALSYIMSLGVLPPARALSIEFVGLMSWDDLIYLQVSVADLGTTSFTLMVEASKDGMPVFRGRLSYVCISPEARRPVPIPPQLRAALSDLH